MREGVARAARFLRRHRGRGRRRGRARRCSPPPPSTCPTSSSPTSRCRRRSSSKASTARTRSASSTPTPASSCSRPHDDEEYAIALLGRGHSGLAYLLEGPASPRATSSPARSARCTRAAARSTRRSPSGSRAASEAAGARPRAARHDGEGPRLRRDRRRARHDAGGGRPAGDRAVPRHGRGGDGSAGLVDEFKRLHAAVVEQTASRNTLASFVPQQLAERLAAHPEPAIEPQEVEVTVLFSDIRGFSTIAERLEAREVASVVGRHLSAMAEVVAAHGGTIDKFQGDAVMAVFGAPEPVARPRRAGSALRDRDAGPAGRAERRRMERRRHGRDGRRHRREHRPGDRRHGRRRRAGSSTRSWATP